MPETEDLCMRMAEKAGIKTVPHALIRINKENQELAYITKRIDRKFTNDKDMEMYAMEDFCQLSNRLTQDKYRGSYEKCAKIINQYSCRVGLDLSELFFRIVFSFVTGNSDMHLKNFSLIEKEPGKRDFVISQAYDLLPVNVILPEDEEEFALTLNGKKRNIMRKDFIIFAESCNISKQAAEKILNKIVSLEKDFIKMCDESMLSEEFKEAFKTLISHRVSIIR
jgi:serine/threonine-protein kinase HipA